MKHLLAIVMFSLLATNALATDPTVVTPSNPTIPSMPTVSATETAASAENTTNRVFIDESGANPSVNITQTGTNNSLGSSSSPFVLRGDNQTMTTIQTGNNNTITGSIYGATSGTGITTTIQQLGNSNNLDFNCGTGTNANCDGSTFNWLFSGNSNTMYYNGGGANQNSAISVTGNSNYFNFSVQAPNASQNINVTGDSNTFNVTQTGGGVSGHSLGINLVGTGNTFTTSQTGTADQVINIKAISNNGAYTVKQSN